MNEITTPDELTDSKKEFFAARFLELEKEMEFAMKRGELWIDTGKKEDGHIYAAAQLTLKTPKGPEESRKIRYSEEMAPYIYNRTGANGAPPAYRVGLTLQSLRKLTAHVRRKERDGEEDWDVPNSAESQDR